MKDITGFEGLYGITSCGKVWTYKHNRFLTPGINKNGYYCVKLCKDGKVIEKYVHRLVAETYIPNPNNLPQINHKDEIKAHNNLQNLEWCSAKYNARYSNAKPFKCIETGEIFESTYDAAEKLNLHQPGIHRALQGKLKTTGSLRFEYI